MRKMAMMGIFAVLLVGTVFAGDEGTGCKLQGTWIIGGQGGSGATTATYMGTGDNEGTEIVFQIDPGIAWLYPNSQSTPAVGTWKKIGPARYEYTMQGYVVERVETDQGPANKIRFIGISSGVKTLTSCDTMEATVKMEYFWPDGTPMNFITYGMATAQRLVVGQSTPLPK